MLGRATRGAIGRRVDYRTAPCFGEYLRALASSQNRQRRGVGSRFPPFLVARPGSTTGIYTARCAVSISGERVGIGNRRAVPRPRSRDRLRPLSSTRRMHRRAVT